MATRRPVAKTLIEYNSNSLDENEEEEKESIDIEFTEQNADPNTFVDICIMSLQRAFFVVSHF